MPWRPRGIAGRIAGEIFELRRQIKKKQQVLGHLDETIKDL
jgi:acid stress-induced BolA-like protein IbaG/YrbA